MNGKFVFEKWVKGLEFEESTDQKFIDQIKPELEKIPYVVTAGYDIKSGPKIDLDFRVLDESNKNRVKVFLSLDLESDQVVRINYLPELEKDLDFTLEYDSRFDNSDGTDPFDTLLFKLNGINYEVLIHKKRSKK